MTLKANSLTVSDMREGEVFSCHLGTCLVISRTPEDRTSGDTVCHIEGVGRYTFIWDRDDPKVERIGKGRLVEKLEIL